MAKFRFTVPSDDKGIYGLKPVAPGDEPVLGQHKITVGDDSKDINVKKSAKSGNLTVVAEPDSLPKGEITVDLPKSGEATAPTDAAPAPAAAATVKKGTPEKSAGKPVPSTESGPEEDLQQFLAQHVEKYFDKIPPGLKSKYNSAADLKPRIAPGGWGPASTAALSGFCNLIIERTESGAGFNPLDLDVFYSSLNPVVETGKGHPASWQGATVLDIKFPDDDSGLLSFLKFAYVATHPGGQSGYDAANEMGIEPKYENSLFPSDPAWQALCRLGAISPFFYFAFAAPAGVTIPPGATITVDSRAFKHSGAAAGKAAAVALGVNEGDKFPAGSPGSGMGPNMWGEAAAAVLKPGNHTVELKIGDKAWSWTGDLGFGKVVELTAGAGQAAGAAPGAAAGGYALLPVGRTVTGRTVPTGTKLFTLQNIYVNGDGAALTREVPAALTKAPRPRGDLFRVESDTSYILIPVRLPAALREAKHWVEALLTTDTAGDSGVVYFPVKSFTILNNRNIVDYGPDGAGAPLRVVYEPLDPRSLPGEVPTGIQLLAAGDIDARGRGGDGFTPAEWAIANYFLTTNNPTGTPLYRTANLNRQINSYPQAQPGRVG